MTDELEQRLRAADPAPATVPVDSPRSPRARTLVEQLMTDTEISLDPPRTAPSRRWAAIIAAAAAVVIAVGVAMSVGGGSDDRAGVVARPVRARRGRHGDVHAGDTRVASRREPGGLRRAPSRSSTARSPR